jgi:general secretion pathway protein E
MPTAFGEKIVMRIFTPEVLVRDFIELGFTSEDRERWGRMIKEPNGIISSPARRAPARRRRSIRR